MLYTPLFPTPFARYYVCKIYLGGLIWQELLLCSILYDYGTSFKTSLVLVDIWIISILGFLHISGVPNVCDPAGQFHTTLLDNQIILINIHDMGHIIITARKEMRWKFSISKFPVFNHGS